MRRVFLGVVWMPVWAACGEPPPRLPDLPNPSEYWVERSDVELATAVKDACLRATRRDTPLLLAFSAPWCIDCRQMRALENQPELVTELAHWEHVVVDVGRLDRHQALLDHFRVRAIAHWVALDPTACALDATQWPVLRASTFEPRTGWFSLKTAPELQEWLVVARGG